MTPKTRFCSECGRLTASTAGPCICMEAGPNFSSDSEGSSIGNGDLFRFVIGRLTDTLPDAGALAEWVRSLRKWGRARYGWNW
jgi:hypothetical protein